MSSGRVLLFMRAAALVFSRLRSALWRSLKSLVAGRALYIVGAGIIVLCLLLAVQIYSLYKELGRKNALIGRLSRGIQERDRVLRGLGARAGAGALDLLPLRSQLSRNKAKLYALKVKLRNKETEMQRLRDELSQREGEIIGFRERLVRRDKKMRALRGEVRSQAKSVEGLKGANQEIARKVSRLSGLEKEAAQKENEISALKKRNAELAERIFRMKYSAELLQKQLRQALRGRGGGKSRN